MQSTSASVGAELTDAPTSQAAVDHSLTITSVGLEVCITSSSLCRAPPCDRASEIERLADEATELPPLSTPPRADNVSTPVPEFQLELADPSIL